MSPKVIVTPRRSGARTYSVGGPDVRRLLGRELTWTEREVFRANPMSFFGPALAPRPEYRGPRPDGIVTSADGRVFLNDWHRDWCMATAAALARQPPATREDWVAQTRRLEGAGAGGAHAPSPGAAAPAATPRRPFARAPYRGQGISLCAAGVARLLGRSPTVAELADLEKNRYSHGEVVEDDDWSGKPRVSAPPREWRTGPLGVLRLTIAQPTLAAAHTVVEEERDDDVVGEWWRLPPKLRAQADRLLRADEETSLRAWLASAIGSDLWVECDDFEREWQACGSLGGCEHDVYPEADGSRFVKRTFAVLHATWQEYFHRLILANALFPAAPFRLDGFGEDAAGRLFAVVSQPAVRAARGAERAETRAFMERLGFEPLRNDDYRHPELGLVVEDLHDQNVLIGPSGDLFVIDPVIFVRAPTPRATRSGEGGEAK